MSSVYPKGINGKTYYYLREMGRVDGKPKMVSERYLGSAADIEAAMAGVRAGMVPDRTRHLRFGDVAAVWSLLADLDVPGVIDEVTGGRRTDAGASVGTYLALAALGRLVEPGSKSAFADFWAGTAADRFTKISPKVLDHRKFWQAMHAADPGALQEISARLAARMIELFDLDISSVALDMTNFATYLDSANGKAPIAQRGKAKQKRTDLRLVGLGLVVTRAGGIPLVWHAYPGNRPDVTQFPTLIERLARRYTYLTNTGDAGHGSGDPEHAPAGGTTDSPGADPGPPWVPMTVVFDAGQNSTDNFALMARARLHFVGSVPPSDCPDLLALPASRRRPVDAGRYPGVSAIDTERVVYGATRRVVLTHSQTLHDAQARSFTGTTLAKAGKLLDDLAATLARGRTRRSRHAVLTEITEITRDPWLHRVIDYDLTGDTPAQHRLSWNVNQHKHQALEAEVFGKRILITDQPDWPVADIVAAYRSQSEIEFGFRQLKDPHQVSFSPMFHWTEHNIAVHTFTCVLALQLACLMRLKAQRAGHDLSVRAILDTLAGIGETVLIYPSTGGRPKARRMTTEMSTDQQALYHLYDLNRWAPTTT